MIGEKGITNEIEAGSHALIFFVGFYAEYLNALQKREDVTYPVCCIRAYYVMAGIKI